MSSARKSTLPSCAPLREGWMDEETRDALWHGGAWKMGGSDVRRYVELCDFKALREYKLPSSPAGGCCLTRRMASVSLSPAWRRTMPHHAPGTCGLGLAKGRAELEISWKLVRVRARKGGGGQREGGREGLFRGMRGDGGTEACEKRADPGLARGRVGSGFWTSFRWPDFDHSWEWMTDAIAIERPRCGHRDCCDGKRRIPLTRSRARHRTRACTLRDSRV